MLALMKGDDNINKASTPSLVAELNAGSTSAAPRAAEIAELSGGAATKPHHLVSERKVMWTTE